VPVNKTTTPSRGLSLANRLYIMSHLTSTGEYGEDTAREAVEALEKYTQSVRDWKVAVDNFANKL